MDVNAVDKEWIFNIFDKWVTIASIEQLDDKDEVRQTWLHYVDVLQKKIASDGELSMIIKDIDRINGYLSYDYIQDFSKKTPGYLMYEPNENELNFDKFQFDKEKKIHENWSSISQKYGEQIEKTTKIKIRFIAEMVRCGLNHAHDKKLNMYNHFDEAQKKMQKRIAYSNNKEEILTPLMEERDIKINQYIQEILKLIAEEQPTLFCRKIKKSSYESDVEYEQLLRDNFNQFRNQLIQEYKNTKIFCRPQNKTDITEQNNE